MKRLTAWTLAALLLAAPTAQATAAGGPPPAALAAAFAELKAGRYAEAEADYTRLLERHPRNPEVMAGLARAQLRQGKLATAYSRLQVLRTLYPDHAVVHYLLGELFRTAGMAQPAARAFTRAVVLNPASQPFRLALARSLTETGQLYVAASQYGRLLEQMEQQQQRPDPAVVYELADLATRLEMTDDAARLYRLLLKLEPEGPRAGIARQRLGLPEAAGAP